VGRISRQKNIHQLLWSLKLLKDENPKKYKGLYLDIYGKEDGLDSPNMGLKRSNYLEELKVLCKKLELREGDDVNFLGFVNREEIQKSLKDGAFVFTSFSLHSDENFGMAALMALRSGGRLLLSHWGGHLNFKEIYPDRTVTIPVGLASNGPFLSPKEMLKGLEDVLDVKATESEELVFTLNQSVQDLLKLEKFSMELIGREKTNIKASDLVFKLLDKRSQEKTAQNVFKDYSDGDAHLFFKAYGACEVNVNGPRGSKFKLAPWAQKNEDKLIVNDPHREAWQGNLKEALASGYIFESNE
jgi:glycosyltransferase involved in cell wall biosynthesis